MRSTWAKVALLMVTLFPCCTIGGGFLALVVNQLAGGSNTGQLTRDDRPCIAIYALDFVLCILLLGRYAVLIDRNPTLYRHEKKRWLCLVIRLNVFAMLFYWYSHIWRVPA